MKSQKVTCSFFQVSQRPILGILVILLLICQLFCCIEDVVYQDPNEVCEPPYFQDNSLKKIANKETEYIFDFCRDCKVVDYSDNYKPESDDSAHNPTKANESRDIIDLRTLNAVKNEITNLAGIGCLYKLNSLDLGSNLITDVDDIGGLTNLSYLDLFANYIEDISPQIFSLFG